ncbi:MAG: enoyl-ACP reductase [bacterium]
MDFLKLKGKKFLVFGLANKKSIAYSVGKLLSESGAEILYSVQSEAIKKNVASLVDTESIYCCDVEHQEQIQQLSDEIRAKYATIDGIVHSIAFANYSGGKGAFFDIRKEDFLQSIDISCFSLITISGLFKDILDAKASVVTISISELRLAAENYGYMAPVKAALDSTICFLAKSFSGFSEVRFNAVGASLLKTSASAGIPGYIDSYLFAEKLIPRKRALTTKEVANTVVFLLSERSSGINAQKIIIDCGMSINYFDQEIIHKSLK